MPDKRIDQLPDVSTLLQDETLRLMLFGNSITGKLYKGVFSIEDNWKTLLSVSLGEVATGIAAGATAFAQIFGRTSAYSSLEINVQFLISEDCTIKNLFIKSSDSQPGTGNFVVTVRKNGASTALSVTIAANGGATVYSNTSDEIAIAAGDLICFQAVNNASTASAKLISIAATLIKTG